MMKNFVKEKECAITIVYDEELKEYAEYLKTLFSYFNKIPCMSWELKNYKVNEAKITSKETFLFLGNSEEIKKYYKFIEPNIICKYGMRYGSKGTRNFMYVEKDKITTKKEYKNFIEYSKKVDEELKNMKAVYSTEESIFDNKIVKGGITVGAVMFGTLTAAIAAGKLLYDWYDDKKNREKIKEQQYLCLCHIACNEINQKLEKEVKNE